LSGIFVALIRPPGSGRNSETCLTPATDGLMEATSNLSFGIAQTASSFTRLMLKVIAALPRIHVPAIDDPSGLSLPSNVPLNPGIDIFTFDPCTVIDPGFSAAD
jgi:hypothetical protein